jgi:hypothetical protein
MKGLAGTLTARNGALLTGIAAISLSIPPLRSLIEQSMVWHMVIQMPLMVLSAWIAMDRWVRSGSPHPWSAWNQFGLTGFIIALMILAYWMLPLAIDRAVVLPSADALKLISLSIAGAVLRHSFERAPAVLQIFFMGTAAPMAIWLGIYFASTDLRLCNAYSLSSQVQAGWGIAALAGVLGGLWLFSVARRPQALSKIDQR